MFLRHEWRRYEPALDVGNGWIFDLGWLGVGCFPTRLSGLRLRILGVGLRAELAFAVQDEGGDGAQGAAVAGVGEDFQARYCLAGVGFG